VYLDGPTGTLLGESEPILPTSDEADFAACGAAATAGVHDLYFVFTSPDAGNGFLFAVMTATFEAAPNRAQSIPSYNRPSFNCREWPLHHPWPWRAHAALALPHSEPKEQAMTATATSIVSPTSTGASPSSSTR